MEEGCLKTAGFCTEFSSALDFNFTATSLFNVSSYVLRLLLNISSTYIKRSVTLKFIQNLVIVFPEKFFFTMLGLLLWSNCEDLYKLYLLTLYTNAPSKLSHYIFSTIHKVFSSLILCLGYYEVPLNEANLHQSYI